MDLKLFSTNTTNIFPIANATGGGQLVTEFNLLSRESVSTDDNVEYMYGQTFVHGKNDFFVSSVSNSAEYFPDSAVASNSVININGGKAVINGHYIEQLVPMTIDIQEVNKQLADQGEQLLTGNLSVGIRIFYSSEYAMDGAIVSEDTEGDVYEGVQVVILPTSEFATPTTKLQIGSTIIDCGKEENQSYVNAHILLATFDYVNNRVTNVVNNYPDKCQMIPAIRVGNINSIVSEEFVKRTGLNDRVLYIYAGKGLNGEDDAKQDTWCNALDSLMVWDKFPQLTSDPETIATINQAMNMYRGAAFITDSSGRISLWMPHKQVDDAGYQIKNNNDEPMYYLPKTIQLPVANFGKNTPGTVDKNYTKAVKDVIRKIDNIYQLTNGHQIYFIETLNYKNEERTTRDLPPINQNWNVGDYILVANDFTISSEYNDLLGINAPSSIYIILPPVVTSVNTGITDKPSGVELDRAYLTSDDESIPSPETYTEFWDFINTEYRGIINTDYFTLEYTKYDTDEEGNITSEIIEYYYTVKTTDGKKVYSDSVQLTAQIPFATDNQVGGFLNMEDNATDQGYVVLDENGHLRLMDYALLRSGTLAYQLGEDFTVPAGLTISEVQSYLDEYVNQRIAFPNVNHVQNAENPNVITINLNLPDTSDSNDQYTVNLYDIDSRFNTSILLNILGSAKSNVTINISDCARIRINPSVDGTPTINVFRSCLYYDASILNAVNNITDLKLWYSKFSESDPDLTVNDLTVSVAMSESQYSSEYSISSSEYWTPNTNNDNHFMIALKDITFSPNGYVAGCSLLVRNNSTANLQMGKYIIHENNFDIPQSDLKYPITRFLKPVNVTGRFVSSYVDNTKSAYVVQESDFSIKTPYCRLTDGSYHIVKGEAAFLIDAYTISTTSPETIDTWNTDKFHYFSGVVV